MKKIKFFAAIFSAMLSHAAFAEGCQFNWHHYGNNEVKVRLDASIGNEVTNNFCPYANVYTIILVTDAFTLGKGCVGYASAGLRKKNSSKMLVKRVAAVNHDTQCNGFSDAKNLAISSAHDAVRSIMFDLENHLEAAKKLN